MRWLLSAAAGAVIGLSAFAIGTASADPTPPPAPGPTTSSSDDLTDMVMDAIQHGGPAAPTTTPVPPPRR
jgi:hypothetical protein